MTDQTKLLLDTDIGSDIDDAVALAYLLAQPRCDLLGITTVSGQPTLRAKIASALCNVAGRDVPIFPGVGTPFAGAQAQPDVPQATALERWSHRSEFPEGEAIEFLRSTIHAHPGEVTLLAIGPLTNVALLFQVDPEIPQLLKQLVLMGGSFANRTRPTQEYSIEWNIQVDPLAAAGVYATRIASHRSVGVDVTSRVRLGPDEVRERFTGDLLDAVADFAEVWFDEYPVMQFNDPLAAATIFRADLCTFERGSVDVEVESRRLSGVTHWVADPHGPVEVATGVDVDAFFDHFFSVVGEAI